MKIVAGKRVTTRTARFSMKTRKQLEEIKLNVKRTVYSAGKTNVKTAE